MAAQTHHTLHTRARGDTRITLQTYRRIKHYIHRMTLRRITHIYMSVCLRGGAAADRASPGPRRAERLERDRVWKAALRRQGFRKKSHPGDQA